jgi:hypothetical protein
MFDVRFDFSSDHCMNKCVYVYYRAINIMTRMDRPVASSCMVESPLPGPGSVSIIQLHCKPSKQCVLCRAPLPKPYIQFEFDDSDSDAADSECSGPDIVEQPHDSSQRQRWQYNLITSKYHLDEFGKWLHLQLLVCRPLIEKPDRVISAFVDFHEAFNYYVGFNLQPPASDMDKMTYQMQLCMNERCHLSRQHHIACCVHIDCWRIARKFGLKENLNASIYALAMSTANLFDIPGGGKDRNEDVSAFTNMEIDHDRQSPVGTLLALLSRFPDDIQLAISEASKSSPLSALASVCRRKNGLLESAIVNNIAWVVSSSYIHLNNPNNVAVKPEWTNIYGHMYISDLQVITWGVEAGPVDCLQIQPIRGLRFALGVYGIRAIRLLYEDGSDSPWLGSLFDCWIGSIYGTEIQMLHILKDVSGSLLNAIPVTYHPLAEFQMSAG